MGSLKFEPGTDHVTWLACDLFHSPPDPLCPTSPGAWNLEAESPWLESAERKSSPAWAQTCLGTASLFVKWDQLIVAQRSFKVLRRGWWSFCKCTTCAEALDFEAQALGAFWACNRLSAEFYLVKLQGKESTSFPPPLAGSLYSSHTSALGPLYMLFLRPGHLSPWITTWLALTFHLRITSLETFHTALFLLIPPSIS